MAQFTEKEDTLVQFAIDALATDMAFALDTRGAVIDGTFPEAVFGRVIDVGGKPRRITVTVKMKNA